MNPLPECVLWIQSLSEIRKYDRWFEFIYNFPSSYELQRLKHSFDQSYIAYLNNEEELSEAKAFRDDFLPLLHKDRHYLESVRHNEERLRESLTSLALNDQGNPINFFVNRLRMRYLYYLATIKD